MMGYGMGGMFMGILFLIIVIIAVYLVIRVLSKNLSESGTAETPLDILKKDTPGENSPRKTLTA